MRKMLLSVFAVLAVFGCGGDDDGLPDCLNCTLCGSRALTRNEFCSSNVVYPKCGGSDYSPSMQFCSGSTVYSKCGGQDYNPSTEFCSGNTVYSKCGSSDYNPSTQFCSGSTVYSKCGGSDYNPSTQFCSGSTIYSKCGGKDYNPSTEFCSGNTVYSKCGSSDYNPSTHGCCNAATFALSTQFCSGSTVYSKCGSSDYNPSTQFCSGSTVYSKCGGSDYNPSTQFCSGSTVYSKCGGKDYNPSTEFCSGNMVYSKCGSSDYNPSTQFCSGSTVYSKCGGSDYNPSTQFCSGSTIYSKCGGSDYNPSTQYCSNGIVKVYGSVTYQGQTYKTVAIGTQTWMAENLDYAVEGSKCYGNDPARCNEYGRLYDWSTAMALPSSCNSSNCSSQIQSKHNGICPSGWHIPSQAEWNALLSYVQSNAGCSSCDAKLLKATSGWSSNGNGTDQYGFSALPGGSGNLVGSFGNVGLSGGWWSANEDGLSAYRRIMHYNDNAYWDSLSKSSLFSVRCVQD